MPESSAIATCPVAAAAARALISAFSSKVVPVSGGSTTSSGSGSTRCGASSGSNSRSLCALRVERTSSTVLGRSGDRGAECCLLGLAQPLDPGGAEGEQVVERGARERRALGGGLDLHEAAVAGHHHVHVDLGGGVLGVVEVEHRRALDHAHRHGRDRLVERYRAERAL